MPLRSASPVRIEVEMPLRSGSATSTQVGKRSGSPRRHRVESPGTLKVHHMQADSQACSDSPDRPNRTRSTDRQPNSGSPGSPSSLVSSGSQSSPNSQRSRRVAYRRTVWCNGVRCVVQGVSSTPHVAGVAPVSPSKFSASSCKSSASPMTPTRPSAVKLVTSRENGEVTTEEPNEREATIGASSSTSSTRTPPAGSKKAPPAGSKKKSKCEGQMIYAEFYRLHDTNIADLKARAECTGKKTSKVT